MSWFEVSKDGRAKILERKGREFGLFELIAPVEMLPMLVEKMECKPPPAIDWQVLAIERYPGVKAYDRPRGRGEALENRRRGADWRDLNIVVDSGGDETASWAARRAVEDLALMGVLLSPWRRSFPPFGPGRSSGLLCSDAFTGRGSSPAGPPTNVPRPPATLVVNI